VPNVHLEDLESTFGGGPFETERLKLDRVPNPEEAWEVRLDLWLANDVY
jgi:hypothetical protein